jgi:hypothetical protein
MKSRKFAALGQRPAAGKRIATVVELPNPNLKLPADLMGHTVSWGPA